VDITVTIGVTVVANLLVTAFLIGRRDATIDGKLKESERVHEEFAAKTEKSLNGVGRKCGKIVLFLSETTEGPERERLTDILKDP